MVFGTARRLAKEGNSSLCIQIGSDVIRSTTSYVYLGVKLDPTLNFGQYLHRTFKKTENAQEDTFFFDSPVCSYDLSVHDCPINDIL